MRSAWMVTLTLVTCVAAPPFAQAREPGAWRPLSPASISSTDCARRSDVNGLSMVVSNVGSFGYDVLTFEGNGLNYPKGTTNSLMYAGGLWIGARVGPDTLSAVTVSEYTIEFGPGAMVGGAYDSPSRPEYRTWKVARWTGNPQDSAHVERSAASYEDPLVHHGWAEYMQGAAPYGAPWRTYRLPDTATPDPADSVDVPGPDVAGDQMLWSVFNDADPSRHTNDAGGTSPLGLEVQQTTFAFSSIGSLGRAIFMRYRMANKGTKYLMDVRLGLWCDPDLGGAAGYTDDLVGSDSTRSLGYCYNSTNNDGTYGSRPPALGLQFLQGPRLPSGQRLPATAFVKFINGTDPANPDESYYSLSGLNPMNGSPIVDPWGNTTTWMCAGDPDHPLDAWLDAVPADRRMMLASGPFDFAPGDTQEVVVAVLVGQGTDRLASVRELRCDATYARTVYESGFTRPFPPRDTNCGVPRPPDCPRSASYWESECTSPTHLPPATVANVAAGATASSEFLQRQAPFCGLMPSGPGADVRALAIREFAAFKANLVSTFVPVHELSGDPIRLDLMTALDSPCLGTWAIEDLAAAGSYIRALTSAEYLDLEPAHAPGYVGVNFGLPYFGGGAGSGWDFFGGTLYPPAVPDSFTTVELRFSHTATQKAYRYLRRQLADGSGMGGYNYAGHRIVNLQAWDVENGVQLDLAFVEKVVTAEDGTILDPGSQPASFDSTWAPSSDPLGDREYLFVVRRPYSDEPKPLLARDGALVDDSLPLLYVLTARQPSAGAVVDDGDAFRFTFGYLPGISVEQRLIRLAAQPLSDPAVAQEYQDIVDCLAAINSGERIGPICDAATPVLLSLVTAEASRDRVRLAWRSGQGGLFATLERHGTAGGWARLVDLAADGTGAIAYEDRDVVPGGRYGYRLRLQGPDGPELAGEAWVDVPSDFALALAGLRDAGGRVLAGLTLAGEGPARLEVLDVAGRRVWARTLEGLAPGTREVEVGGREFRPGLYFLRLAQDGRRVHAKCVLVR